MPNESAFVVGSYIYISIAQKTLFVVVLVGVYNHPIKSRYRNDIWPGFTQAGNLLA
jgi:hypothetical protein